MQVCTVDTTCSEACSRLKGWKFGIIIRKQAFGEYAVCNYHYRKLRFCRVHHSLPCANSRAHGKHDFCRVCSRKHTAKPKHTQSHGLPCAFFSTRQRNTLPCAFLWHTAKSWFAVCFFLAHGKAINFFCLLTLKLFLLFTYNMWHSMLKFDTFLYLFVIFN